MQELRSFYIFHCASFIQGALFITLLALLC
jgi:hypothetical protein